MSDGRKYRKGGASASAFLLLHFRKFAGSAAEAGQVALINQSYLFTWLALSEFIVGFRAAGELDTSYVR
jgi:hypothetical protein